FVQLQALPDNSGRIDLPGLLDLLGAEGCNEVLVEAGATLAGSFFRQGLLDEIVIYMSPKLLGSQARPLFELPIERMAGQLPLKIHDIRAVGGDFRLTLTPDPDSWAQRLCLPALLRPRAGLPTSGPRRVVLR